MDEKQKPSFASSKLKYWKAFSYIIYLTLKIVLWDREIGGAERSEGKEVPPTLASVATLRFKKKDEISASSISTHLTECWMIETCKNYMFKSRKCGIKLNEKWIFEKQKTNCVFDVTEHLYTYSYNTIHLVSFYADSRNYVSIT